MTTPSGRARVTYRVGTELPRHPRFLRMPRGLVRAAALGVWTAAGCYSRGEEQDGFCPAEAIEAYATEEVVAWLVDAGLFAREEQDGVHGFRVLRYKEWNETKAQIDKRLKGDRIRQKNSRKNRVSNRCESRVTNSGRPSDVQDISVGSPGTGTGTGSDLQGEREREPDGRALLPPEVLEPNDWVKAQCDAVNVRHPTAADVAECLANARAKGHIRADWQAELARWMLRSRKFERDRKPSGPVEPSNAERAIAERRARFGGSGHV